MKCVIATVSVWVIAVSASAQTLPNPGALDIVRYDDGSHETVWKVSNPSQLSDYFNVDMDGDAPGCVVGLLCNTSDLGGGTQGHIGLYPDNLGLDPAGHTPDLTMMITGTSTRPAPGPLDCSETVYDVPDITLPIGVQTHVVMAGVPGDSSLWLCADSDSPGTGRGFFSMDGYSTPSVPLTPGDFFLGVARQPSVDVTLWVNGGTSTVISEQEEICILFRGETTFQPFMIFVSAGGVPIGPAVSVVFFTGLVGPVDSAGKTATICSFWPCNAFVGTLGFMAFYKSASGAWRFSSEATVTARRNDECIPCTTWGQRDDGIMDSTIWKIQNPAGPNDWFNVHHGPAPSTVTSITGVEVASWDFCGTGPSWARVGVFDSNLGLDSTGGTPDVSSVGSIAEVWNAPMPAGASEWAYPATFYNTGPAAPGTKDVHSAVKWPTNDSCIWIAADTDGTDDTSGCSRIPGNTSYFTMSGYVSPATPHLIANYMQKIIWN